MAAVAIAEVMQRASGVALEEVDDVILGIPVYSVGL
jgi:hypothetical protein